MYRWNYGDDYWIESGELKKSKQALLFYGSISEIATKKVIVATIKQKIAFDFCFRCISSIPQRINMMLRRINTYGRSIEICAKMLNKARIKALADSKSRRFISIVSSLDK